MRSTTFSMMIAARTKGMTVLTAAMATETATSRTTPLPVSFLVSSGVRSTIR